jgi:hypothetical protein
LTSFTVIVNIVVPTGNEFGALLVTVATPQLSDVTGVPITTFVAKQEPVFAFTVIVAGQVIVGA